MTTEGEKSVPGADIISVSCRQLLQEILDDFRIRLNVCFGIIVRVLGAAEKCGSLQQSYWFNELWSASAGASGIGSSLQQSYWFNELWSASAGASGIGISLQQ